MTRVLHRNPLDPQCHPNMPLLFKIESGSGYFFVHNCNAVAKTQLYTKTGAKFAKQIWSTAPLSHCLPTISNGAWPFGLIGTSKWIIANICQTRFHFTKWNEKRCQESLYKKRGIRIERQPRVEERQDAD